MDNRIIFEHELASQVRPCIYGEKITLVYQVAVPETNAFFRKSRLLLDYKRDCMIRLSKPRHLNKGDE